jgi:hypothetical protein
LRRPRRTSANSECLGHDRPQLGRALPYVDRRSPAGRCGRFSPAAFLLGLIRDTPANTDLTR